MDRSQPFRLTMDDVQRAGLQRADVGSWCLKIKGAYHLFASEQHARRAHDMMLKGQMVR